jgi:hypothetical protein
MRPLFGLNPPAVLLARGRLAEGPCETPDLVGVVIADGESVSGPPLSSDGGVVFSFFLPNKPISFPQSVVVPDGIGVG